MHEHVEILPKYATWGQHKHNGTQPNQENLKILLEIKFFPILSNITQP